MEIGIDSFAYTMANETGRRMEPVQAMAELLERMEHADRCGLDVFGIGEHHREEYLDASTVTILAAAAARCAPDRLIETRHLLCGLLALLSVPALFRWGRLLGQPWLGVFSAVVLLLSPRFFGHAFLNSKDMPFAVGMTASLAALTALLARRRYHWREFIECGLLLGCTTAVRPGGWMLLGPLYLAGAFMADWQTRQRRSRRRARRTPRAP